MQEIWKTIPGFDWYQVSNLGRVRSVDHIDTMGRRQTGKIQKLVTDGKNNYLYATISRPHYQVREGVHRLVAKAFIPNPDNLKEINHKDENKKNNVVWNLEWCTRSYNNAYGGRINGEKNCMAKLKEHEARYIREHPEEGTMNLAKKFGISPAQTSAIIHGKRWCWL